MAARKAAASEEADSTSVRLLPSGDSSKAASQAFSVQSDGDGEVDHEWQQVEEMSPTTELPIVSGDLHVVYTADTVGAISWGISPLNLMPCCLGERKKGVKILHCGFQFGRHLFLVKQPAPKGERGQFYAFVFPNRDGTRGCLEMTPDGKKLTTGDLSPGDVAAPKQLFRVTAVSEFSGTYRAMRWSPPGEASNVGIARYVISPATDLEKRLTWKLNGGVVAKAPQDNTKRQVFLIRPRAPFLVTDFVVDCIPFCERIRGSFSRVEDDYRRCLLMHHSHTKELPPMTVDPITKEIRPSHPAEEIPVLHDFLSTQLARTAKMGVNVLGLFNSTSTIVIAIGLGYRNEPIEAIVLRILLYTLVGLTYFILWLMHNQYYASRMFEFVLRRGFILQLSADMTNPSYLFFGGWLWYWVWIVAFHVLGGIYLVYYKEATLGTLWLFFSNAFLYFVGQLYRMRAPFDQETMALSTFIKSFDNGLITEVAISRAGEYLKKLRPVQACVPLANPPAYAYLGQLPASIRCCWGCGKFAARATIIILLCIIIGAGVIAAIVVRQLFTQVNAFDGVNVCTAECLGLLIPSGGNATATTCSKCLCLCARTLQVTVGLQQTCQQLIDVPGCAAAACPTSDLCRV